jgi:hypothetical protein
VIESLGDGPSTDDGERVDDWRAIYRHPVFWKQAAVDFFGARWRHWGRAQRATAIAVPTIGLLFLLGIFAASKPTLGQWQTQVDESIATQDEPRTELLFQRLLSEGLSTRDLTMSLVEQASGFSATETTLDRCDALLEAYPEFDAALRFRCRLELTNWHRRSPPPPHLADRIGLLTSLGDLESQLIACDYWTRVGNTERVVQLLQVQSPRSMVDRVAVAQRWLAIGRRDRGMEQLEGASALDANAAQATPASPHERAALAIAAWFTGKPWASIEWLDESSLPLLDPLQRQFYFQLHRDGLASLVRQPLPTPSGVADRIVDRAVLLARDEEEFDSIARLLLLAQWRRTTRPTWLLDPSDAKGKGLTGSGSRLLQTVGWLQQGEMTSASDWATRGELSAGQWIEIAAWGQDAMKVASPWVEAKPLTPYQKARWLACQGRWNDAIDVAQSQLNGRSAASDSAEAAEGTAIVAALCLREAESLLQQGATDSYATQLILDRIERARRQPIMDWRLPRVLTVMALGTDGRMRRYARRVLAQHDEGSSLQLGAWAVAAYDAQAKRKWDLACDAFGKWHARVPLDARLIGWLIDMELPLRNARRNQATMHLKQATTIAPQWPGLAAIEEAMGTAPPRGSSNATRDAGDGVVEPGEVVAGSPPTIGR